MKKFILYLTILMLSVFVFLLLETKAQMSMDNCGTMEYLRMQKKSDPTLESKMLLKEQQIQQWIKENNGNKSQTIITIPIVIHIVYNTEEQNIPDKKVYEQLAITNRDYAGLNPHSMHAFPDSLKAHTGIQFCLAQKKPDGTQTNGIERRQTNVISFVMDNKMKSYNSGGLDAWDPTKYMNIWVCNMEVKDSTGYVYSGYAQFPGTGTIETFGVVIRYGAFGLTDSNYFRGNGVCMTHELAHCFYLRHIWGDDGEACTGTDYCEDTPNQAGRTTGIHSGILTDSCSPELPGIMYMNFMDYTDDIVDANFTPGQSARMNMMFESPYGYLVSLGNSDACSPPTSIKTNISFYSIEFNIFPNPIIDKVTINYRISEPGIVKFSITNILGIDLAIICNNHIQEPGNYSIKYDASIFTPGVYYLNISFGNITETKKFVLIR